MSPHDAIDAGLARLQGAGTWAALAALEARVPARYYALCDALDVVARSGQLQAVRCDGRPWLAVETQEQLAFTRVSVLSSHFETRHRASSLCLFVLPRVHGGSRARSSLRYLDDGGSRVQRSTDVLARIAPQERDSGHIYIYIRILSLVQRKEHPCGRENTTVGRTCATRSRPSSRCGRRRSGNVPALSRDGAMASRDLGKRPTSETVCLLGALCAKACVCDLLGADRAQVVVSGGALRRPTAVST